MNKNYFEVLRDLICSDVDMEKFSISEKSKNELSVNGNSEIYKIKYDESKKLVILSSASDDKESELSSWLLDNETATQKDVALIAKDFVETISGKYKNRVKQTKKKAKSSDESNITGLFFANRMASIFPELKPEIQREKESYSEFRAANFASEKILPRIQSLAGNSSEKSKLSKFGKLLSDLYQNGTLDTRSIITMGILNFISGDEEIQNLKKVFSPELVQAWDAALKYKNKKISPKKTSNRKSLLSRALEAQQKEQ